MSTWYYNFIQQPREYIKDIFTGGQVEINSDIFNCGLDHFYINFANCRPDSLFGKHHSLSITKVDGTKKNPIAAFASNPDPRGPIFIREVYAGTTLYDPERNINNFFVCTPAHNPNYVPWLPFTTTESVDMHTKMLTAQVDIGPPTIPPPYMGIELRTGIGSNGSQGLITLPNHIRVVATQTKGEIIESTLPTGVPIANGWKMDIVRAWRAEVRYDITHWDVAGLPHQASPIIGDLTQNNTLLRMYATRCFYK